MSTLLYFIVGIGILKSVFLLFVSRLWGEFICSVYYFPKGKKIKWQDFLLRVIR